jgi:PLP dependent protein
MQDVALSLKNITTIVDDSCAEIIAVSKNASADLIAQAATAGQLQFAEKDIQHAIAKQQQLQNKKLVWHYIGAMQTKKSASLAKYFDCVQSICTIKQAKKLDQECYKLKKMMDILVQVNISKNPQQSGCSILELDELLHQIKQLDNINLCGMMCIASRDNPTSDFQQMQQTYLEFKLKYSLDTLSMGMSNDYLIALKFGSTQVRLGSIIFGR